MKFIRALLDRKGKDLSEPVKGDDPVQAENAPEVTEHAEPSTPVAQVPEVEQNSATVDRIANAVAEKAADSTQSAVNIWDLDGAGADANVVEARKPQRRRRNKTRVLGFDAGDDNVVSAFDAAEKVAPTARSKFPVGWIVVADGPGRGECFSLEVGMSQIGRGEDQAIRLDFGDNAVSRENHAAIVYDPDTHCFIVGHGGKKNIVRVNGKPLISNEELNTGDEIKVGETTLRFIALCTKEFNWSDSADQEEEHENVAIA